MGAVGRILIIVILVVLVMAGAGYFLMSPVATRSQTVDIQRPAETVLARLASTPQGTVVAEGVTLSDAATAEGDIVSAPVRYSDGVHGRIVYTVTPTGEGSRVRVTLERNLGSNPLNRLAAVAGGGVDPLIGAAAQNVSTDLNALPNATFEGLAYTVVQVDEQPFFYLENCSQTSQSLDPTVAQTAANISSVMRQNNLDVTGPLTVIESPVVSDQYCFRIGYPYAGRAPRGLLVGKTGQIPGGAALRVAYTGPEEDVIAQVYDRVDALLAAAHLDDPSTSQDDWVTYEVYHDDPRQPGGSRNREIFFVAPEGLSRLSTLTPPDLVSEEPWSQCLADIACVIRCYQFDSQDGQCPPRQEQIARLFREGMRPIAIRHLNWKSGNGRRSFSQ